MNKASKYKQAYLLGNLNLPQVPARLQLTEDADYTPIQMRPVYRLYSDFQFTQIAGPNSHPYAVAAGSTLIGGDGYDYLVGTDGDDVIDGGKDGDIMEGGQGNDTYYVDNRSDRIMENLSGGEDTIITTLSSYTLGENGGDNVENLQLAGTAVNGYGNSLNNKIIGNEWDNELSGGSGSDALNGGKGDDKLYGGEGSDTLIGGEGDDIYYVDSEDILLEYANQGTDTVYASISYSLGDNLDNLMLVGFALSGTGNDLNNKISGNSSDNNLNGGGGDDTLDGGTGADTMRGGLGNDVYYVNSVSDVVIENSGEGIDNVIASVYSYTLGSNIENLVLAGTAINATGNDLNNDLTGNTLSNTFDGGLGADTMRGGQGADRYFVESASDVVIENAGEGHDTVYSTVTFSLSDNVEDLVLLEGAVQGTGNNLENGIWGSDINNILDGNAGNDTLDGGVGADTLIGGLGDDTFYIDTYSDVINENSGEGNDTIYADTGSGYSLSENNVEDLVLLGLTRSGSGNSLANRITGNDLDNYLDGGAYIGIPSGIDTLIGGKGNDVYIIDDTAEVIIEYAGEGVDTVYARADYTLASNIENLILQAFTSGRRANNGYGNDLNNKITGSYLANLIEGRGGDDILLGSPEEQDFAQDTLIGGQGDDAYYIYDTFDIVMEQAGQGTDTVYSSVDYTLHAHVEKLILTGDARYGYGNDLANTIYGTDIAGNYLDGGLGADTLIGGGNDDTYIVDNLDVIIEAAGGGTDTVHASVNHTLAANVENLLLTGSATFGTGNDLNNTITGNNYDNVIDGKAGADTMIGAGGSDIYYVDNELDVVIEDFAGSGRDTIYARVNYTLAANVEDLSLLGAVVAGTGNELDNQINGNSYSNSLNGGAGADWLQGGDSSDTLTGGTGADQFWFGKSETGLDIVNDFTKGEDKVVCIGFGTGSLSAGYNFAVDGGPTGARATFIYNTTTGVLSFDQDGTGSIAAAQIAAFSSKPILAVSDFIVVG